MLNDVRPAFRWSPQTRWHAPSQWAEFRKPGHRPDTGFQRQIFAAWSCCWQDELVAGRPPSTRADNSSGRALAARNAGSSVMQIIRVPRDTRNHKIYARYKTEGASQQPNNRSVSLMFVWGISLETSPSLKECDYEACQAN